MVVSIWVKVSQVARVICMYCWVSSVGMEDCFVMSYVLAVRTAELAYILSFCLTSTLGFSFVNYVPLSRYKGLCPKHGAYGLSDGLPTGSCQSVFDSMSSNCLVFAAPLWQSLLYRS